MQHLLRYKIIILITLSFCFSTIGMAQLRDGINLPDHDSKRIRFGINLGINRSHFNFLHHPIFLGQDSVMVVESVNSTGLNLAWLVNLNINEHFDIRTFP